MDSSRCTILNLDITRVPPWEQLARFSSTKTLCTAVELGSFCNTHQNFSILESCILWMCLSFARTSDRIFPYQDTEYCTCASKRPAECGYEKQEWGCVTGLFYTKNFNIVFEHAVFLRFFCQIIQQDTWTARLCCASFLQVQSSYIVCWYAALLWINVWWSRTDRDPPLLFPGLGRQGEGWE